MNDAELDELLTAKAAIRRAGSWKWESKPEYDSLNGLWMVVVMNPNGGYFPIARFLGKDAAAFIAAAANKTESLVAEVKRLRSEVERLREAAIQLGARG